MIGKLKGKVDAVGESFLIIDVNGVGYEVQASSRTLRNLKAGDAVSLTIDTHVREDAIRLFGFQSEYERSWFRTLQSIQGVGAKVALSVLGIMSPQDLASAVAMGNWAAVEEAPGVGKKLAQRIVAELKDKVPGLAMGGHDIPSGAQATPSANGVPAGMAFAEALSALTNLGYNPSQATAAVAVAAKELGEGAETAGLIKRSLKELAR
ncbi:Holliday junction branch migration protein RuvA [Hyphomicrobium sp.]|uniref:Holliday junction branch migration protein RuvA n=1 Tax=Hyphomicrobium sp. TaxID=82 RepID=UPI002D7909FA|nr:Holliday junction branch migration protein RuvA [Hyphomicrobium sp.]HET6390063.1 Holliday junction branch migration protein RuvA [Hyphomicrobium sp.]